MPAALPVSQGGISLREWPEAGPSKDRDRLLGADGVLGGPDGDGLIAEEMTPGMGLLGAKAVAAMTGAVTTSLLMTPFDVLKTRLQTVPPKLVNSFAAPKPAPTDCCQTTFIASTRSPPATLACASNVTMPISRPSMLAAATVSAENAPSGCLHPSKWAGIWGEVVSLEEAVGRGMVSLRGTAPMESAGGFWNEIALVRQQTGIRGLWKGVGTTLAMSIPSSAIYMVGYEYLLARFTATMAPSQITSDTSILAVPDSAPPAHLTPAPLIAGATARTISATVISPIEMFRTRLQALPHANTPSPSYSSTFKDMSTMVQSKGLTVLWRGLGPTLWRDVPFSGIYWAGVEMLKIKLAPQFEGVTLSFVSGALSGTLAALLTQPFDVLKTRRQVFSPSASCSPEALRHRASTWPIAMHVIKTEGWSALFAGVVPRCGKVAPACGLMIACYEGVGRYLGDKRST